jgi:quinolinate synthase
MKLTRLEDIYLSLKEERYKVEVEDNVASRARKALNEMLKYA